MKHYHYFGGTLACEIELPELVQADEGSPATVTIRVSDESLDESSVSWEHVWTYDHSVINIRAGTRCDPDSDPSTVIQFPEFQDATFVVDASLTRVTRLESACPAVTQRHLLLDQVLPRVFGQQQWPVIHGAALVDETGRATLVVGDSGAGKSTLVQALALRGLQLLSDDCLLITRKASGFSCQGNYPGCRLLPDSMAHLGIEGGDAPDFAAESPKRRVPGVENQLRAAPVHRLVELDPWDPPSTPRLETMSSAAAAMAIQQQRFMLNPSDHQLSAIHLGIASAMATETACLTLHYRQDYAQLDELVGLVLSLS